MTEDEIAREVARAGKRYYARHYGFQGAVWDGHDKGLRPYKLMASPFVAKAEADRLNGLNAIATYRRLTADDNTLLESFKEVLAYLVAATSLLKAGGKKAAPSNKMFDIMVADYEKAIEAGRATYKRLTEGNDRPDDNPG